MSDRIKELTAITEDDVAWGKIKLTGSGVHAKETLGV